MQSEIRKKKASQLKAEYNTFNLDTSKVRELETRALIFKIIKSY